MADWTEQDLRVRLMEVLADPLVRARTAGMPAARVAEVAFQTLHQSLVSLEPMLVQVTLPDLPLPPAEDGQAPGPDAPPTRG